MAGAVTSLQAGELDPAGFERRVVSRRRPCLLGGAIRWPAVERWTREELTRRAGHRVVHPVREPRGDFGGHHTDRRPMRFSEYLATYPTTEHYLAQCPLARDLPELLEDVSVPHVLDPARLWPEEHFIGWFAPGPVRKWLHFDYTDNVLCIVRGAKRVRLFARERHRRMRPRSGWSRHAHLSRVPEPPAEVLREGLEVVVEAGETLFIPAYWWHHVESLGESVAINFWYEPADRPADFAVHVLESPLPWPRRAWRLFELERRRRRLRRIHALR